MELFITPMIRPSRLALLTFLTAVFAPVLPAADAAEVLGALFDGMALQVYSLDSDASGSELIDRLILTAEALLRPARP